MTILLVIYLIGFVLYFIHGTSVEFDDGSVYDGIIARTVGALLWPLALFILLLLVAYMLFLAATGKREVKFYWRKNAKGNSNGRS